MLSGAEIHHAWEVLDGLQAQLQQLQQVQQQQLLSQQLQQCRRHVLQSWSASLSKTMHISANEGTEGCTFLAFSSLNKESLPPTLFWAVNLLEINCSLIFLAPPPLLTSLPHYADNLSLRCKARQETPIRLNETDRDNPRCKSEVI